jgi:hypothetical protein
MRQATQKKIDALHAQIAELVRKEKAWHDKHHPDENKPHRHISHTQIECKAWEPRLRESGYAVLSMPGG